jgi:hypothetical protein
LVHHGLDISRETQRKYRIFGSVRTAKYKLIVSISMGKWEHPDSICSTPQWCNLGGISLSLYFKFLLWKFQKHIEVEKISGSFYVNISQFPKSESYSQSHFLFTTCNNLHPQLFWKNVIGFHLKIFKYYIQKLSILLRYCYNTIITSKI